MKYQSRVLGVAGLVAAAMCMTAAISVPGAKVRRPKAWPKLYATALQFWPLCFTSARSSVDLIETV
jgi:hypothetical protein